MRRAISTSPSRVSRATEAICRMYMRTGSTLPAVSRSTATAGAGSSSPCASSAGSGDSSSSASSVPSMATTPSRRSGATSSGRVDRFAAWFVLISGSLLRLVTHPCGPPRHPSTSGARLVRELLPLLPGGAGRHLVAARLGGTDLLPQAALRVALAPPADRGHAVRELLLAILPLGWIVAEEPGRDAVAERARQRLDERRGLGRTRRLGPPSHRRGIRAGQLGDVRVDQRHGAGETALQGGRAVRADVAVRILARGEEGALPPQACLDEHREAARRGPPARRVAVEAGDDAFREAPERAQLLDGERRPERGHGLRHARLGEGDQVEVPLDDDGAPRLPDRIPRLAEPVEGVPLAEERGLGRVQILRWGVPGGGTAREHASPEGDDPPARVRGREHEAVAEAIEETGPGAGAIAAEQEARGEAVLDREPLGAQVSPERLAARRRVAEAEAAHRPLADAPLGEVGTGAGARRAGELGLEERRGGRVDRDEGLATGARPALVLGHRDAEARRHAAHGVRERERLDAHDKREDVAVLAAPEAVEEAALLAHREGGCLLGVEGTEPDEAAPSPPERDGVGHDLDQAGPFADTSDRVVADAASHTRPQARRFAAPGPAGLEGLRVRPTLTTPVARSVSGRPSREAAITSADAAEGTRRWASRSAKPRRAAPLASPKTAPAARLTVARKSARAARSARAPSRWVVRLTATKSTAHPIASARTGRRRWRATSSAPRAGPQAAATSPPASNPTSPTLSRQKPRTYPLSAKGTRRAARGASTWFTDGLLAQSRRPDPGWSGGGT